MQSWDGGAFITPTAATDFGDNSYIVIEPVTASEASTRWQVKLTCLVANNSSQGNMKSQMSFSGGWSQADPAWVTYGATYAVSALQTITYYHDIDVADSIYLSCSDSDTWTNLAGTQTYSYFRCIIWDQNAVDDDKFDGVYAGGYIPADVETNTKPAVICQKQVQTNNQSDSWGSNRAAGNVARTVVPGDYVHSSAAGVDSGFIGPGSNIESPFYGLTPEGAWANMPVLLSNTDSNTTLGTFGKYTMLNGDKERTTGALDTSQEYMVSTGLMLRWKPSA